jgi:S1-C subfamily serine protease
MRVGFLLDRGDVITKINGQDVDNAADASRQLQRVEGGRPAMLLVQRGGQEVFLSMRREQR